jgi:hypothetical protein
VGVGGSSSSSSGLAVRGLPGDGRGRHASLTACRSRGRGPSRAVAAPPVAHAGHIHTAYLLDCGRACACYLQCQLQHDNVIKLNFHPEFSNSCSKPQGRSLQRSSSVGGHLCWRLCTRLLRAHAWTEGDGSLCGAAQAQQALQLHRKNPSQQVGRRITRCYRRK